MVSLVLTIIAFAGAMGVPVFLTAIVESAASKIRPSSSRTMASPRMNWTDQSRPFVHGGQTMLRGQPAEFRTHRHASVYGGCFAYTRASDRLGARITNSVLRR